MTTLQDLVEEFLNNLIVLRNKHIHVCLSFYKHILEDGLIFVE
jgi:hypothetical protein